ncbi:hypothetical protein ACFL1E_03465 [Candidatus Omnitrophota bacterium]
MDLEYQSYLEQKSKEQETLCKRCGVCCGAIEADPCQHLIRSDDGLYSCAIYDCRFGLQKTKSGREFLCVPIRSILHKPWLGSWQCSYKKSPR